MKRLTPLRNADASAHTTEQRAAEMLRRMRPPRELSNEGLDLGFRAAYARSSRGRATRWRWTFAFAAAAATAALLWAVRPAVAPLAPPAPVANRSAAGWRQIDIGDLGTIELSEQAALPFGFQEQPTERQLKVDAGRMRAHIARQDPGRPVVVITPHVRVVVVGTRFDVEVEPGWTTVDVLEGRVRVETPFGLAYVGGGESIRSDDPRLAAPAAPPLMPSGSPAPSPSRQRARAATTATTATPPPAVPAPAEPGSARCAQLEKVAERRRCLEDAAAGSGLAAQNALYALGRMAVAEGDRARALEHWRAYERRFPDGMFASEAALGAFEALVALGRSDEARRAAESFERRFADDPRAVDVALVRARLLCAEPLRRTEGHELLNRLAAKASSDALPRIERLRARCAAGMDEGAGATGAGPPD